MQILFTNMEIQVSKKVLKQEAKYAKKFLVMIKRKLNRGQIPHDLNFRRLLALLDPEDIPDDGEDDQEEDSEMGNSSEEDDDSPRPEAVSSVPEPANPVPDAVEPSLEAIVLSSQEGLDHDDGNDDDDGEATMKDAVPEDEGQEGDAEKVIEDEQQPSSGSNGDSTVPSSLDKAVEKKHVFEDDPETNAKIKSLQKMLADAKRLQTARNLYSLN
eukprot:s93_g16.t1